ncbi:MAG: YbaK/EbsC family protein [Tepidisphaeraceae bacterium]|jgi:Ala-tRNA(Pro) deacylase
MSARRIQDLLASNNASYRAIKHDPAFTAQEVAQSTHVPGKYMAKTLVVCIDGHLALAVVPATKRLDLTLLRSQAAAKEVRLADESEFEECFGDCEVGTAPPFGNLFGIRTFVDVGMAMQEEIAFNAGTHTDVVIMRFADYSALVKPLMVQIAVEGPAVRRLEPARAPARPAARAKTATPQLQWSQSDETTPQDGWSERIQHAGAD